MQENLPGGNICAERLHRAAASASRGRPILNKNYLILKCPNLTIKPQSYNKNYPRRGSNPRPPDSFVD